MAEENKGVKVTISLEYKGLVMTEKKTFNLNYAGQYADAETFVKKFFNDLEQESQKAMGQNTLV